MNNERKNVTIYCDGGNRLGSSNYSAFASIVLTEDINKINEGLSITKSFFKATNNQMELLGFLSTITNIFENYGSINPNNSPLTITVISDSQYLIKGANEYIENWSNQNWNGSNNKPIKNSEIWKTIKVILDLKESKNIDVDYDFKWTKGHVKDCDGSYDTKYNNECDKRLNEAMDNYTNKSENYNPYVKTIISKVSTLQEKLEK